MGEQTKFTWAYMKRFALGALNYTPERFGATLVGDFLDAVAGYNEAEGERIKVLASLVRTSTWYLWNTHVTEYDRKNKPEDLWPFAWEKEEEEGEDVEDTELNEFRERQKKFLSEHY